MFVNPVFMPSSRPSIYLQSSLTGLQLKATKWITLLLNQLLQIPSGRKLRTGAIVTVVAKAIIVASHHVITGAALTSVVVAATAERTPIAALAGLIVRGAAVVVTVATLVPALALAL
jgi:hypothetical protein